MRIAQIVATLPPHVGGMGAVAWEESKRLAARGHQVTIFTLDHGGDYSADANQPFKIVRLKTWLKAGDAGWTPRLLFKIKGFDVIHLHYPFYGTAEFVWLAKIFLGIKYVVTYHMEAMPKGWFKILVQKISDFVFSHAILFGAEKVIVVDAEHFAASKWAKRIDPKRLEIIPNAIDTELFNPARADRLPSTLTDILPRKFVLFVGNPLPFKRLDFLLRAFSLVTSPDSVLVIRSDGYEIERYKQMTRELGLQEKVIFVGRLSELDLAACYGRAQCLVVPAASAAESFSLVSIAALSSGCPVIVSDTPGVRGRVNNGVDGLIFKSDSVEDLARCITTLLNQPDAERARMGSAGRAKAIELYGWEKHMDKLEMVYKSI